MTAKPALGTYRWFMIAGAPLVAIALTAAIMAPSGKSDGGQTSSPLPPIPMALRPDEGLGAQEAPPAPLPPVDLTEPGSFAIGTAEVQIIDTNLIEPQIQADTGWTGRIRQVKEILPPHTRPDWQVEGAANDLVAGELGGEIRVQPGELWPGLNQTPWTPPDPALAVGPEHVVMTVNMAVGFYRKDGTLIFSQNLDNTGNPGFFEDVGAGNFTFDPKCFYDHLSGRFVIVALEVYGSTQSWIDIAVSDDSDPTGVWYKYRTNSVIRVGNNTYWVDYPGFGYDGQAYYVTGNLFGLNNSGFGGVLFRSFDKRPLLNGQPAVYTDVRDGSGASVQAGQHFGSNSVPFFVSVASTTSLRINAIENALSTPVLRATTVSVPSFSYPSGGAPNGGGTLDVLDGRILNVHWRNGNLYAAHCVRISGKNQARWYHMQTGNWPFSGSVTLVQSGNVDGGVDDRGAAYHTFFPAIYSNRHGDVGLVVGKSSTNKFASVEVTGRRAGDPPGTMGPLQQLKIGSARANGRYGDYYDIAIDPVNDSTFWVIGEYSESSGWATWIGSFDVTVNCPGDLDGDGDVDQADLATLLAAFGLNAGGDLDGDGDTDQADLAILLANFGTIC
jgi:hypothetical protein